MTEQAEKEATAQDVATLLQALDIGHDGFAVLHVSLRAIGPFAGGAEGLLRAFTDYLSQGMLMVPTHTWATVNRAQPVFDVRSTVPCVGVFPQICARKAFLQPGAVRTLHPTHSAALFGKHARQYAAGEENVRSRTAPEGVWGRLYGAGARVLLVGVGLERNTYMHSLDEAYNGLPYENPDSFFPSLTIDAAGQEHRCPAMNCNGYWPSRDFPLLEPYLRQSGALSYATLGHAAVTCFDVPKGHDAVLDLCRKAGNAKDLASLVQAAGVTG